MKEKKMNKQKLALALAFNEAINLFESAAGKAMGFKNYRIFTPTKVYEFKTIQEIKDKLRQILRSNL